jgi:hypothetical protein
MMNMTFTTILADTFASWIKILLAIPVQYAVRRSRRSSIWEAPVISARIASGDVTEYCQ